MLNKNCKLYYWRTSGGAEVDCVLDLGGEIIPIEIKSSKTVSLSELKGLESFIKDYKRLVRRAYVVTPEGRREKISDKITRIPWNEL
jgi:predicted AAA+ superfamily ATPase